MLECNYFGILNTKFKHTFRFLEMLFTAMIAKERRKLKRHETEKLTSMSNFAVRKSINCQNKANCSRRLLILTIPYFYYKKLLCLKRSI